VSPTPRRRTRPSRAPVLFSVAEKVDALAALSVRHMGLHSWRMALRGARSGLSSLSALREALKDMDVLCGKQIIVTGFGAHLASVEAAFQENFTSLRDAYMLIERPLSGALLKNAPSEQEPAVWSPRGSPSSSMQDVPVTVGLDEGGDTGALKSFAEVFNQPPQNTPSNTILAVACTCLHDKYDDLALMPETHVPQLDELLLDRVLVRGVRRPGRVLLLASNYAAE